MKHLSAFCFAISLFMFANGFPAETETEFDLSDADTEIDINSEFEGMDFLPIPAEQIQCIKDGVRKVVDDNPELQPWLVEVEKSANKLMNAAKKCDSLADSQQKICFFKLKIIARAELLRLIKLLPKNHIGVLVTFKNVIQQCLE